MKNRSFPGKNDVAVAYEISGTLRVDSDRTLFARNTMMHLQAEGQAAPVWIRHRGIGSAFKAWKGIG